MPRPDGTTTDVAVKILHPGIDPTAQAIQRLQDEARLLGLLQHPSIIRVVDLLTYRGRLALVTEYVDGEDLSGCFEASPPPSPRAMLEIMGRVANALDAAWRTPSPDGSGQLRLIHRDIKPSNIRISSAGDVKLLDFGLAHADHADRQAQTENHALIGSFLYMAPERYLQEPATSACDAFGIGCCLYEGLAGEKLFEGRKPVDLYGLLMNADRWDREMDDRVDAIPSTVPTEARRICRALLTLAPQERMTVTELADTWEDVVESMTGPTLDRWASVRDWPEPQEIRASLEGSVVASRIVQEPSLERPEPPPDPYDDEDDDDDAPTVRVRASDYKELLAELERPATETPGQATRIHRRDGPSSKTVAMPIAQEVEPSATLEGASRGGSRVNWVGAGLLTVTTLLVSAAVVAAFIVVVASWYARSPEPTEPPTAELPPPPEAPDARVTVDGAQDAWLTRGSRRIPVGGVPAGMWTLWVDFGSGGQRMGTLRVPDGEDLAITCSQALKRCRMPGDPPLVPPDGEAGPDSKEGMQ